MLQCVVTDFFNNQPDALIIQIYYVIKFYMFRATSLPIIRSFFYCIFGIGKFHAGSDDSFQAQSGWALLGSGHHNLHETYQSRMYIKKTPDDGQRSFPKHLEFYDRINLDNQCVWLVIKKEIFYYSFVYLFV